MYCFPCFIENINFDLSVTIKLVLCVLPSSGGQTGTTLTHSLPLGLAGGTYVADKTRERKKTLERASDNRYS